MGLKCISIIKNKYIYMGGGGVTCTRTRRKSRRCTYIHSHTHTKPHTRKTVIIILITPTIIVHCGWCKLSTQFSPLALRVLACMHVCLGCVHSLQKKVKMCGCACDIHGSHMRVCDCACELVCVCVIACICLIVCVCV